MSKIKLLALFGESGAGKDSIQRWLTQNLQNTHGIVSYTSRPQRTYEKQGYDYHFISDEKFEELINNKQMLEYTIFNRWYYGTPLTELDENKINIGVFNPRGVHTILTYSDQLDILPVWILADDKVRLLRCLSREKNPNCMEICRRFLADKDDFMHIDFKCELYYNNDNNNDYSNFLKREKIIKFIEGLN